MKTRTITIWLAVVMGCAAAQAKPPQAGPAKAKPKPPPALVVLDYDITMPGNRQLGTQMADILTARLSIEDSIRLVERAKLGKIIEEQKLKLVGIVDQDQAVKVGKLVGAKLMVMGKGFVMDKKLMIITKVVGVETGLVKGTIRRVELSKPISEAIMLLAEDIAKLVKKDAARLLPAGTALPDPVAEIRRKLDKAFGKKPRPAVAVVIPEEHKRRAVLVVVIDPAVETEIKRTLIACGYRVVDTGRNDLADWAKRMFKGGKKPWPPALTGADVVVVGEAFSEFALRTGDLVTCAARAEINAIDRKTGRIIKADRQTQRAVDLAENIAGKTALQKAGRKLGLAIARALIDYPKPPGKPPAKPKPKGK